MADASIIKRELGYKIGSIPPFGLLKKLPVFIDTDARSHKEVGVGAGKWGVEIFLSPKNLLKASGGKFASLSLKKISINWDKLKVEDKYLPRIESASDLECNAFLKDIAKYKGKEITICGWVYNKRSSGKIQFLQIRDGSGDIQAIVEEKKVDENSWKDSSELTIESSIQVTGKIREDKRSPFAYEMDVKSLKIIQIAQDYPIGKKSHGPDFLMDNRHLWLRSNRQRAILKIRDEVIFSLVSFLHEEGFTRVDTPIFQPVSCEDTSELFEVDYFGNKTYLSQSGQLYCEAAEYALGRTYDFGPVFRAEKSKTRKHLIEFWMMDAELPFTDLEGLMDFEEKLIKKIISDCLKNRSWELKILKRDSKKLENFTQNRFERITHKEAIDILKKKFKMKLSYLDDIGAPEEAKLAEIYKMPIFITGWPAEIKAFYMPRYKDENVERVKAVDLMAAEGFGEICGGAEREFDFNKLLEILEEKNYPYEDYKWYMDLRKYGTIPHSGFGIGIERTVRWITGIKHIRETIPFARMLNRLYP